jgi:spore maturation protein CgeB
VKIVAKLPDNAFAGFYRSSRLTLAVAPPAAAGMGYCPTGRMFDAAACGVPVLTEDWEGLDYFFEPGREILVARTTGHVLDALNVAPARLEQIGRAGRDRVLSMHTAARRALELENILQAAISLPVEPTGAGSR